MHYSRFVNQTPSVSSGASTQLSRTNKIKSPVPSDYEYLGRLVTRERPIVRKSKSLHQNLVYSQNKNQYRRSAASQQQEVYDDITSASSDDETSNALSRPVGVIRINERHLREIYRIPTPPPKVKRVYHRLRSPEAKVIERVFVRRPAPEIIENIIEVPPEKVRIINREKYLENSKPITRSKLIHLKARPHHRKEEQEQEQQSTIASQQYSQQRTLPPSALPTSALPSSTMPVTTTQQNTTGTAFVFSPEMNACTVGQVYPTSSQAIAYPSQQTAQVSAQQMTQPSAPYTYAPQQTANQQMYQPTPYTYPAQQSTNQQMFQPTAYDYQPQQQNNQQMFQTTPYNYQAPQQTMPNCFYAYPQY